MSLFSLRISTHCQKKDLIICDITFQSYSGIQRMSATILLHLPVNLFERASIHEAISTKRMVQLFPGFGCHGYTVFDLQHNNIKRIWMVGYGWPYLSRHF